MATTPNYGWVTPAPTDYLVDLPADFETFADAVDADLAGLLGGTTDQALVKDSNSDHAFSWKSVIRPTIADAKGDILAASAADTIVRLPVGTANQVLTVDSGETTGLKWASPQLGTINWTLLNSGGTATTSGQTVTINVSSYSFYFLWLDQVGGDTASATINLRLNGDTGTNYYYGGNNLGNGVAQYRLGAMSSTTTTDISGGVLITGGSGSGIKTITSACKGATSSQDTYTHGYWSGTAAVTSISLFTSGTAFDEGTVYVYAA